MTKSGRAGLTVQGAAPSKGSEVSLSDGISVRFLGGPRLIHRGRPAIPALWRQYLLRRGSRGLAAVHHRCRVRPDRPRPDDRSRWPDRPAPQPSPPRPRHGPRLLRTAVQAWLEGPRPLRQSGRRHRQERAGPDVRRAALPAAPRRAFGRRSSISASRRARP